MPTLHLRSFIKFLSLWLIISPSSAQVMIHEIMYRPADVQDVEPTQFEFIELFNSSNEDFDLSGSAFVRGVNYSFENGTIIPAGGFLVIAASPSDFTSLYPSVSNVVGPWTGRLSNSGERIELVDSSGETIDEIRYSDQGDWAQRIEGELDLGHRGWEWETAADGGDRSLELINPEIDNENGQNWDASSVAGGTPGAQNSITSTSLIPLIEKVKHTPAIPKSAETVTISAEITSSGNETFSPTLFWRISTATPGNYTQAPMTSANDNDVYSSQIPPHPESTVIEFYIEASSDDGTRTWPAPTNIGQTTNALFQFDDEVRLDEQATYRLILSTPEDLEFTGSNDSSNALFNATFIAEDGSISPTVRYLCGVRVRGASSRRDNPRPLRVALPHDSPWDDFTELNLNTQFTSLQLIGMRFFQAARIPAPNAKRVQVRRNGVNRAGNEEEQYGSYVHLQPLSGDFIEQAFPESDNGNVYKKTRPDNDWAWREGSIAGYLNDGWSKETNGSENDWSDLDTLLATMSDSTDPDYLSNLETIADIDQWMNWFAVMAILANGETNISNGADDDYSMYNLDGRLTFLPHDLDTILGEGDNSRITNPEHTVFDMITDDDVLAPLVPFFELPQIRERYLLALRNHIETTFQPESFNPFIQQQLGGWVPENRITDMTNFLAARVQFITELLEEELGPAPARPTPDSLGTLEKPTANLMISEVFANSPSMDFIEIHNESPSDIDLTNYTLTDNPEGSNPFTFEAGTTIAAGGRLVIELDDDSPFSLSKNGESLFLFNSNQALLDDISWGPQLTEFSISRTGQALTTWALTTPTPGAPPSLPITLAAPSDVTINEWLTRSAPFFESDFVELYNSATAPTSIGGLSLSNDPVNAPTRATLPPLSYIASQGFLLLEALGGDADPSTPTELPFRFSGSHQIISLRAPNGVFIDQVNSSCLEAGITQGRIPDGGSQISLLPLATPEAINISPSTTDPNILIAQQLRQSLRITEIMYNNENAPLAEFIELQNIGTTLIDLSDVAFTNGVEFAFTSGTLLSPGEYLIITSNQTEFEAVYGTDQIVSGTYSGRLNNGGENIRLVLLSPFEIPILDFSYDDAWYPSTDGQGFSLQITNPFAPASTWGLMKSWQPSGAISGNPGNNGPPIITSSQATSALQFSPFEFQITAINDPRNFALSPLPEGLTIDPLTGLISGIITTSGTLDLTVIVSNAGGESMTPLQIIVDPLPLPQLTSPTQASALQFSPFQFQITAINDPRNFALSPLPEGLTIDPLTGLISGIITTSGILDLTVIVSNASGESMTPLQIIVDPLPLPKLTSPVQVSAITLNSFTYQITATTEILSYESSATPAWLNFDSSNGIFTGTAPSPGTFTFPITFTNQTGSTTEDLTIIIVTNPLADALDFPIEITSSGDAPWFRQSLITFDSQDAAQSGSISNNQSSNLSLNITGPDTLTFRWRVSSERSFDFLRLRLDDTEIARIDGERDWELFTLNIPEGLHTITWVYDKDGSVSSGSDAGWVDDVQIESQSRPIFINSLNLNVNVNEPLQFQITTSDPDAINTVTNLPIGLSFDTVSSQIIGTPTVLGSFTLNLSSTNPFGTETASLTLNVIPPLNISADAPNFVFQTGGDAPWFAQGSTSFNGPSAPQSGVITAGQESWIETTITGPNILIFHWSTSSEAAFDFLTLSLNGQIIDQISGEVPFTLSSIEIPNGQHTVRWTYRKDGSVDSGQDAAWIDNIAFASYSQWQIANNIPVGTLPTDDLDGDGYPILLEYALGGSPNLIDSNLLPLPTLTNDRLSLSFNKPIGVFGIQYLAEGSSDLVQWSDDNLEIVTDTATSFEVQDRTLLTETPRRFMRIRVILTNP